VVFHCEAALQARPTFAEARVMLAKALIELGELQTAREQLEIAIKLDESNAEARQNLAETLYRQGEVAKAVTEYRAALRLRPDWDSVLNNLAWILATDHRPEIRNGNDAVVFAQHACELTQHTNVSLMNTLAVAYAEAGQFSNAVVVAQNAARLAARSGQQ